MKKIIHFQIPIDKTGTLLIRRDRLNSFIKNVRKTLPKYYKIIMSPFSITIDKKSIKIDSSNIENIFNKEECIKVMKEMIEKEGYIVTLIK